jgi:hypothetical protein
VCRDLGIHIHYNIIIETITCILIVMTVTDFKRINVVGGQAWWLTSVIPEVETGESRFKGSLGKEVTETLSQKISWVW